MIELAEARLVCEQLEADVRRLRAQAERTAWELAVAEEAWRWAQQRVATLELWGDER